VFEGDPALAHHQDTVGKRDRLVDVMRDQQDTGPMGRHQFTDERVHADAGQRIQRGKGFVEQQKFRLLNQRPSQRHALRLSAGEVAWPVVQSLAEPHFGERSRGSFACVRRLKAQRYVAPETVPRHQAMFLENDGGTARRRDATTVDRIKPGQRPQQRGLATSALAKQHDKLAAFDAQIEVLDDDPAAIGAAQIGHHDGRGGGRQGGSNVDGHRAAP
jgi:hypothetical protein